MIKRIEPSESQIQKSLLEYLSYHKGYFWRSNTGAFAAEHKGKKRYIKFGVKGCADIIGCIPPNGQMVAIEVKRPGKGQDIPQKQFQEQIEKCGGVYFVATCVEDLIQRGL